MEAEWSNNEILTGSIECIYEGNSHEQQDIPVVV